MKYKLSRQNSKKQPDISQQEHPAPEPGSGVVADYLHEVSSATLPVAGSPSRLIQAIHDGLPFQELDALQAGLAIPMDRLASRLGISKATLHRRKGTGGLTRRNLTAWFALRGCLARRLRCWSRRRMPGALAVLAAGRAGRRGAPGLRGDRDRRARSGRTCWAALNTASIPDARGLAHHQGEASAHGLFWRRRREDWRTLELRAWPWFTPAPTGPLRLWKRWASESAGLFQLSDHSH